VTESNTTDTDTESLKGLDYWMHQLEKDIKFSKSLYEIDKKAWLKHGEIPLYEVPMLHHKRRVTELTSAYEEIKRLHDVARSEGLDGDWIGEWNLKISKGPIEPSTPWQEGEATMIKTTIQFKCTWQKEKVQKLFDSLINADGITELGTSMIFTLDEPALTEEPEQAAVHTPEPKHINAEPPKPINIPWPVKEGPQEQAESDPDIFTEIERISGGDLGHVMGTNKPILLYAETKDGRVAIYYNESPMYTTLDTVRSLPDKIPPDMVKHLSGGKRAALRGFKKFLTGLDASENVTTDIDPYAPILTGGAKVDTHASGKVEGDLE
jgi:hypothetical protein